MKNWLFVASACVLTVTSPKGHASARPLQELNAAVSSLKFDMPATERNSQFDGPQTMAAGMGVNVAQMFDMMQNGVTPERGTCPPAPLAECTSWIEAASAMKGMFMVYEMSFVSPFGHSCVEIGNFASLVYNAKKAKRSLGEILSVIGSASGNFNKATLLQGVAIAIYGDGSLNRDRAFKSAYTACQTWLPQPRSR